MGDEAPQIKRPVGLGIFQPVTDCKDDSYDRLQDESKRDRPAHRANEVLPNTAMREQPFHGLQPPRFSGIVNPIAGRGPYKWLRGLLEDTSYFSTYAASETDKFIYFD